MKNVKILLTALVFMGTAGFSAAQTKVAHINSVELMESMPKAKDIENAVVVYAKRIETKLTRMQNDMMEIEKKVTDSADFISDAEREIYQQDYNKLYSEYTQGVQSYDQMVQQKRQELFAPMIEELTKIIKDVAKEKGYDYVLDSSEGFGLVLFASPTYDLMPDVMKRLEENAAATNTDGQ